MPLVVVEKRDPGPLDFGAHAECSPRAVVRRGFDAPAHRLGRGNALDEVAGYLSVGALSELSTPLSIPMSWLVQQVPT